MRATALALVAFFAAAVLAWPGPAFAQAPVTAPDKLGLNILDVRLFGNWTHEDQSGYFRGILARENAASGQILFVLQWIALGKDQSVKLIKSLSPPELAKEGVNVVDYRHEMDADGLALFIDTVHPQSKADTTYEMFVFNPNEYEINPASN